jgi:hypothetical protein
MYQAEPLNEIVKRYRAEGRRVTEAVAEHERQLREQRRDQESAILEAAKLPNALAHTIAVAEQISDHRAAGNYTTIG